MRILFIKQLFNPEPTAKSLDFALELKSRGHEIQVLTGFPSYPLGRIYDGYRQRLWQREFIKGIEVIRVPIYPNQSDSGLRRMMHYLSYAISASVIGLWLIRKPDVAFVYQGAIPVGIPAVLLKWLRKIPFVYDINDMWPESVSVSGMLKNRRLLRLIEAWCQFNYRQADQISVATPGFRDLLITKGVPPDKLHFVPNWSRDRLHREILPEEKMRSYFPPEKFHILYAGNLGVVQSLDVVLDVALVMQNEGNNRVEFHLLGGGADGDRLKERVRKLQLRNVLFHPRVDSGEVGKYLNSADVLFVHLKNTELFEITIPSKILSYLRTGKPILMGLKGNAAKLIEESESGLLFEPEDVDELKTRIDYLLQLSDEELESMGARGPVYYQKNLSIESSTDKLEKLFERAIMNNNND